MVQCAVEGCSSRSDTGPGLYLMHDAVHFHRVPQDPDLREEWRKAIKKSEVNRNTRVCSLHFRKDCYYTTKLGFPKLVKHSVPELELPIKVITKDPATNTNKNNTTSNIPRSQPRSSSTSKPKKVITKTAATNANENDTMSKVPPKQKSCSPSHSQQSSTSDDQLIYEIEDKEEIMDFSEDEEMSDVKPEEQHIQLPGNVQQNTKENTINNVKESKIIKPGVQKYKIKTALERKFLKGVRKLQDLNKRSMEAIHCLLDQNRRLLERNSFLEKALNNSKKVAGNANHVAEQESMFFKIASVKHASNA